MFARFRSQRLQPPPQPTAPPATQGPWPGQKAAGAKPGPGAFAAKAGSEGPKEPPKALLKQDKPGTDSPLLPDQAGPANPRAQGRSPEPPPLRQPPVDPALKYEPDRQKIRESGIYVPIDRQYYVQHEKGNRQVFTAPEHWQSSGKVELTPGESAHRHAHRHMLKRESMGTPIPNETQLTSRVEDGRLYPNQRKLLQGDAFGVDFRPGMYPDGTRYNSHTHVSPHAVPNAPSTEDRMVAHDDATNKHHGPNTRMERGMMMDMNTGKDFVYTGEIRTDSRSKGEYSPFYQATDPYYNAPIPKGTDLFAAGVEIPVVRKSDLPKAPPPAHLPPAE